MFLRVEKSLRGGISQVSKRYAKSNNPLAPDFDPTKQTSYIVYLDENNLYRWAMSQYLPTGNFQLLRTIVISRKMKMQFGIFHQIPQQVAL